MRARSIGLLVFGLSTLLTAACSSAGSHGEGGGGAGGDDTGSGRSSSASSSPTASGSSSGTTDPNEAARVICVDKINELRTTKGLPAFGRWKDAEACVDQEATQDEMNDSPHGAWKSGQFECNGSGQNECLGAGVDGIASCLDQMWAEGDQAECAGCDACADAYDPTCKDCDFYGQATGHVCGHYVNMSAKYFTMAACGFSSLGGWDAINFK